jgi:hypothetical protein
VHTAAQVEYFMMRDRMRCGGSQRRAADELRQRMDVRESRALRAIDASGARTVRARSPPFGGTNRATVVMVTTTASS